LLTVLNYAASWHSRVRDLGQRLTAAS